MNFPSRARVVIVGGGVIGCSVAIRKRFQAEEPLDRRRNGSVIVQPMVNRVLRDEWRDHHSRDARAILLEGEAEGIVRGAGSGIAGSHSAGG